MPTENNIQIRITNEEINPEPFHEMAQELHQIQREHYWHYIFPLEMARMFTVVAGIALYVFWMTYLLTH